jgi:hypothetical protein
VVAEVADDFLAVRRRQHRVHHAGDVAHDDQARHEKHGAAVVAGEVAVIRLQRLVEAQAGAHHVAHGVPRRGRAVLDAREAWRAGRRRQAALRQAGGGLLAQQQVG